MTFYSTHSPLDTVLLWKIWHTMSFVWVVWYWLQLKSIPHMQQQAKATPSKVRSIWTYFFLFLPLFITAKDWKWINHNGIKVQTLSFNSRGYTETFYKWFRNYYFQRVIGQMNTVNLRVVFHTKMEVLCSRRLPEVWNLSPNPEFPPLRYLSETAFRCCLFAGLSAVSFVFSNWKPSFTVLPVLQDWGESEQKV